MTEHGLINGIAKDVEHKKNLDEITTISEFHQTLRTLLKKGYLTKVGNRSHIPQPDLQRQIQDTVIAEQFSDGKISGPKKKRQFDAAVNDLKRKWEDEDAYSNTKYVASRGVIKRSKDSPSSSKRVKLNGDMPNGVHDECVEEDVETEHSVPKLPVLCCSPCKPMYGTSTNSSIRMKWLSA